MSRSDWADIIARLDAANVLFRDGLTDEEIAEVEKKYDFRFPPDLRDFLQTALPTGFSFPDWRSGDEVRISNMLDWPLHGIIFDVEHNNFWLSEWGVRPARIEDARTIVEEYVRQAPRLIPINGHRMIPDRPHRAGNPILSVYQTDIIYYGFDLDDYFRNEFTLPGRRSWPSEIAAIEFWEVDRWQNMR